MNSVRVIVIGLGPIGRAVGSALVEKRIPVLGGADPAPEYTGSDLGELLTGKKSGQPVVTNAQDLYRLAATSDSSTTVAVLCTGSRLPRVMTQIEEAIAAGCHVVSTCEELVYPYYRHPELAARIHAHALRRRVAVVGTGVNPGFVMDRLPLILSAVCVHWRRITIDRIVDVAQRRLPLQKKVGVGLCVAEFRQLAEQGNLGHVGLAESAALLAHGLGIPIEDIAETLLPVVENNRTKAAATPTEEDVTSGKYDSAQVLGVYQTARIQQQNTSVIDLTLQMSYGAPSSRDRIIIDGDPPVDLIISGGIHGDRATIGTILHAVQRITNVSPGLHTILSLPMLGSHKIAL